MTQYLNKTGNQQLAFAKWSPLADYPFDSLVVYNNRVYKASSDVPAGTPFTVGLVGPTWQEVVAGSDAAVGVPFPQLGKGSRGYGRMSLVGNTWSRAGDGDESQPRVYGFNITATTSAVTQSSIGIYMDTEMPQSWSKFYDTGYNLYALTPDGVLYGFASGESGQFGDGTTTDRQYLSVLTGGGRWFGDGITVLDFWSYDSNDIPSTDVGSLFVHVNNNGVLQLWSTGNNAYGMLGNNLTTNISTPFLIPEFTGKSIVNGFISRGTAQFVTSTGEVWGAGYNPHGQFGVGTELTDQKIFVRAKLNANDFVTNAASVYLMWDSGTGLSSYILLNDGTALAAGTGNGGRLGDGDTSAHELLYFKPVLKALGSTLTDIAKIEVTRKAVGFLDADDNVWWAGLNEDAVWGNGQTNLTAGNGFAVIKQTNVVDFWAPPVPRGYASVFYLKDDLTLWACASNTDYQLGVVLTAESTVETIERVALPRDEYPVDIRKAGQVNNSDVAYMGTLFLTQKGNVYFTGRSVTVNPDTLNSVARFPRLIIDNLINEQTKTL